MLGVFQFFLFLVSGIRHGEPSTPMVARHVARTPRRTVHAVGAPCHRQTFSFQDFQPAVGRLSAYSFQPLAHFQDLQRGNIAFG
jgi:hypothetical protein